MSTHKELARRLREIADRVGNLTGDRDYILMVADLLDTLSPPDGVGLTDDDPFVLSIAEAIARQGVGRPWDDFDEVNAFDLDQSDLIGYAKAAAGVFTAAIAAEKERADEAEAKLLKSVEVNLIAIREKNAAEARCDTLAGALEAMRTWLGVVAAHMDLDPDDTRVTISAVSPAGKREVAARSLRDIYEQADAALSTIPAKPATETKP